MRVAYIKMRIFFKMKTYQFWFFSRPERKEKRAFESVESVTFPGLWWSNFLEAVIEMFLFLTVEIVFWHLKCGNSTRKLVLPRETGQVFNICAYCSSPSVLEKTRFNRKQNVAVLNF